MGVKKTGDWAKVMAVSTNLKNDLWLANRNSLKKIGLEGERRAVKHIVDQDLEWQPLSDQYKARKIRQSKSEKILVRSSVYYQAITSQVVNKKQVFAGVLRKVKTDEGDEVADIAKVHEFGSIVRNIPRRPLWGPVMEEIKAWLKETDFMDRNALNFLKRKYGI